MIDNNATARLHEEIPAPIRRLMRAKVRAKIEAERGADPLLGLSGQRRCRRASPACVARPQGEQWACRTTFHGGHPYHTEAQSLMANPLMTYFNQGADPRSVEQVDRRTMRADL